MSTISNRHLFSNMLLYLTISFVTGVCFVLLGSHFGYPIVLLFVCGLPIGLFFLPVFPLTFAKFRKLAEQLRWWHFLWLLAILSSQVFRVRDTDSIQETPIDFWALYRIGFMFVIAVVLLGRLVTHRTDWDRSLLQGLIGILTVYALINLASTIWSVQPMWTFYKSAEYLVLIALIAAVLTSVRTIEEVKILYDWNAILIGSLVVTVWLGIVIWPEQALGPSRGLISVHLGGVLPNIPVNSVGEYGAYLCIVSLSRLLFPIKHKKFYIMTFLFGLGTLILSQSRSPLLGFLIAIPLILFAAGRIGIFALLYAVLIPAIISLTNVSDIFSQFIMRGQNPELFASLTGRVGWWQAAFEAIKEQPFLGYGAYAGTRFVVFSQMMSLGTGSHIHNVFIEILLGSGILGLIAFLYVFVRSWLILIKSIQMFSFGSPQRMLLVESIGILTLLSVRSFFSSGPFLVGIGLLTSLIPIYYAELIRRGILRKD